MERLNILFICHSGMNRSKTARDLFKDKWNTKKLGIYVYPNFIEINKKLPKLMYWADYIVVMKCWMKDLLEEKFPNYAHDIIDLDIDDYYHYNEKFLCNLLMERMSKIELDKH